MYYMNYMCMEIVCMIEYVKKDFHRFNYPLPSSIIPMDARICGHSLWLQFHLMQLFLNIK